MSQYQRVKAVLERARKPLALHDIAARIWRDFSVRDSEAAISARIREIRHDLVANGRGTVIGVRAGPDKAHHIYAITYR